MRMGAGTHARELGVGRRSCVRREHQVVLEQGGGTESTFTDCASALMSLMRSYRSGGGEHVHEQDVEDEGDAVAHLDAPL